MIFVLFCDNNFYYIMGLTNISHKMGWISIDELHQFLSQQTHSEVFILVDQNTKIHCLPLFAQHFKPDYIVLEIAAGEHHKNIETTQFLWQQLTELGADRHSVLINLGGGVITDIGGFVALTFKRGMRFINIPTTLLGMVDAAIGGKTGIDFNGLKNQIGIIAQPDMILIIPEFLSTLPNRELHSGLAEIYKYALIDDEDFWTQIAENKSVNLEFMIQKSIEVKEKVVSEDPQEKGLRKILNFGHTLGHAIETHFLTKSKEKQLLHGEAVAVGMIMASHLSYQKLVFDVKKLYQISSFLNNKFTKTPLNQTDIDAIFDNLKHDKKNKNGVLQFVLLEEIGKAKWDVQVTDDEILKAIMYYKNLTSESEIC